MDEGKGEERKERPNVILRALDGFLLAVFRTTLFLFRFLPASFMYALFRGLGAAVYYARPGMRRRLKARISEALPEISDEKRLEAIARGACATMFMPMLDMCKLGRNGERYMRGLRVEGEENLDRAAALGKGVIFVGAHLGEIATAHAVMARRGRPYTTFTYNPADTTVPRYLEAMIFFGGLLGCDPEEPVFLVDKDVIPRVREHLAKGKWVGIAFDVPGSSVVQLFGKPAAVGSGWAHFSYDSGAPIVPMALLRGKDPYASLLIFGPPIFSDRTAERRAEVQRIMNEAVAEVERFIRMAPEQWMGWFPLQSWREQAQRILAGGG
ncbi:MAG: hypothetical protein H5T73_06210 [Actinobacteria bacterium]|nr:hypothetical protein [Actinomycetota bacterium]